ncbi:hypothetical protein CDAR_447721 [Caerostris darwini]|uniref:Uncharacterized protein n=1 Tax=Caerostris darwini TaxID=1538125 RepID=A0AAV4PQB4_9ARAC|nr:hypothetical protein CDAR_447721 [Caerostris darwini]
MLVFIPFLFEFKSIFQNYVTIRLFKLDQTSIPKEKTEKKGGRGEGGIERALTLSQPIKEFECVPQDRRKGRGATNPSFPKIWPRTPYRRLNTGIEWSDKRVYCKNRAEPNDRRSLFLSHWTWGMV